MLVKRDTRDTPFVGVSEADLDFEADLSGVPTPRGTPWSNDHLTSAEELPVVTAKKEPTQRGLGIPPPPSASESDWRQKMPSISSLSPLTVDAFDPATPAPSSTGVGTSPTDIDATENERITVRAPAPGATPRQRRRAMSVTFAAAAVLLLCLFVRKATLEPERVSAAEVKPMLPVAAVAPPTVPTLRIVANAAPRAVPKAIDKLPAALPLPTASAAPEPKLVAPTVAASPSPEPRAEKKRRARTERRSTELEAPVPGSELVDPWRSSQPSASPPKPVFSLPPR